MSKVVVWVIEGFNLSITKQPSDNKSSTCLGLYNLQSVFVYIILSSNFKKTT